MAEISPRAQRFNSSRFPGSEVEGVEGRGGGSKRNRLLVRGCMSGICAGGADLCGAAFDDAAEILSSSNRRLKDVRSLGAAPEMRR